MKLTKEQVRQSQSEHPMNLNTFFSGIGYCEGTFSLQVKGGSHPYQMPPRKVAYMLQKLLKEQLKWLQRQQIIVLLGIGEISEWCNSFTLVSRANGSKVMLKSQALIRPIDRGPTLTDICPKLTGVKYLTLKDDISGYHNLQLDENSSYLMTFSCPFGRY